MHVPAMQIPDPTHVGPSQVAPSFPGGAEQPVAGSQVPGRWQASVGQTTDVPAVHAPAPSQVSPMVHLFPSSHGAPFAATRVEQMPVAGVQTPTRWQAFAGARQTVAVPPTQVPVAPQVSPVVHRFPSSHGVPTGASGLEHAPVDLSQIPAG